MAILLSTFLFINAFATSPVSARYNASSPFKLKAHVLTQPNPAFECLYLEPYHISPAYNYALLLPKTTENPGIIGHLNGTAADFVDENTDLLFDFSPGPYGFVIDQFNATYNPILIDAGNGTQGMFIDQGVIKYHNPISGGFYACNNTLPFGPAIQVFYKSKVISTPAGCSDVELIVEYV